MPEIKTTAITCYVTYSNHYQRQEYKDRKVHNYLSFNHPKNKTYGKRQTQTYIF